MGSEGSRPARRPNSSPPRGITVRRPVSDKSYRRSALALPESFFQTDPLLCAENLIGTELVWGKCAGIVVETEAYLVEGDEASHTFRRPSTRAFVERNKPGAAYIYFNYGVHWMLNVLVKGGPRDGLILIRAIEPRRGLALMRKRRGVEDAAAALLRSREADPGARDHEALSRDRSLLRSGALFSASA